MSAASVGPQASTQPSFGRAGDERSADRSAAIAAGLRDTMPDAPGTSRVDNSTNRNVEATGLALPLVRSLRARRDVNRALGGELEYVQVVSASSEQ